MAHLQLHPARSNFPWCVSVAQLCVSSLDTDCNTDRGGTDTTAKRQSAATDGVSLAEQAEEAQTLQRWHGGTFPPARRKTTAMDRDSTGTRTEEARGHGPSSEGAISRGSIARMRHDGTDGCDTGTMANIPCRRGGDGAPPGSARAVDAMSRRSVPKVRIRECQPVTSLCAQNKGTKYIPNTVELLMSPSHRALNTYLASSHFGAIYFWSLKTKRLQTST